MTGKYDICINQYATYARVFTWFQDACCGFAAGSSPDPVDLTGWTAVMQIRAYPLSTTILYDASGDLSLGGDLGTIALVIPASDTQAFTWWRGFYDLLLISPIGVVTRLLQGAVKVSPGVTVPNFGVILTTDDGQTITTDAGTPIAVSND